MSGPGYHGQTHGVVKVGGVFVDSGTDGIDGLADALNDAAVGLAVPYALIALDNVNPYTADTAIGLGDEESDGITVGATSFSFDEPGLYYAQLNLNVEVDGAAVATTWLVGKLLETTTAVQIISGSFAEPQAISGGNSLIVTLDAGRLFRVEPVTGSVVVGDPIEVRVGLVVGSGTLSIAGNWLSIFRVRP